MTTVTFQTKEEITKAFAEAMKQLVMVISSFDDDKFNQVPFEGSWTAGQVSEHLYKSISRIPDLLETETTDAGRDPFEKCIDITSVFLDFEKKFKSPSFILPSNEPKQVSFFVKGFTQIADDIKLREATTDLAKLYTKFPFPGVGELTGWEWICFAAAHSIRHTRQLKNIREHLYK